MTGQVHFVCHQWYFTMLITLLFVLYLLLFIFFMFSSSFCQAIWAAAQQNQQNDVCPSDWPPILIRVFAVHSAKDPWFLHADSEDWWSDWADAQADLSLPWAPRSFCWFCHAVAHFMNAFATIPKHAGVMWGLSWKDIAVVYHLLVPKSIVFERFRYILKSNMTTYIITNMSCIMTKPTKWSVRPAKTQISLGLGPVWSESSLFVWRSTGSLATHSVHSEDSDQTGRIWVFAGCAAHFVGFLVRWLNYVQWSTVR